MNQKPSCQENIISECDRKQKKQERYEFWIEQGKVLARFGCYQKALFSIDQALGLKPGSHQGWIFRGNILLYLERYEAALTSFQQALKIQPQHQAALFYCSVALYYLGQHTEAYLTYKKAVDQGQQPILRKLNQLFQGGFSIFRDS